MLPKKIASSSLIVLTAVVLVAAEVSAQQAATIAGVVRDTTGAVLPGVTVEAASPALIEKVRSVVTDSEGIYQVVDLRPGTYSVTFSLTGFSRVVREGVELTAGFTAAINGEMRVGTIEETVVVTGASPLVDIQNVRQQKSVSDEILQALPTGTTGISNLAAFTPGLTTTAGSNVGGAAGTYNTASVITSSFHGKTGAVTQYDGMGINNLVRPGATGVIISPATLEEWTVETGGGLAESNAANSIAINVVPKSGGNTFSFTSSAQYANNSLQSDNLTDALRARNLTTVNTIEYVFNADATLGGPIKKDKIWFFTSHRFTGNENQRAGIFFNSTQGTPFYTPDPTRPGFRHDYLESHAARVTWQVSAKNKINAFVEPQWNCTCRGRGELAAPEAALRWDFWPTGLYQATWNSTISSKLLLEAGVGMMRFDWPVEKQTETGDAISITDQATGIVYGSLGGQANWPTNAYGPKAAPRYTQRFSATYVTGSHAFKTGFNLEQGRNHIVGQENGDVSYRFRGSTPATAVPNQVTLYATPFVEEEFMKANLGVFAQDRWTLNRLTLNYGLRFEYLNSEISETHLPAGRWVPARDMAAIHDVPSWTDISPRLGAAYDVFGNGRTAIKASFGRYSNGTNLELAQLVNPLLAQATTNRSWNDRAFGAGDPRSGNFIPDCDMINLLGNGECGQVDNLNFGQTVQRTRLADDLASGFGKREYLWDLAAELQQQIGAQLSVTGGYYRNWAGNLTVTDNLAVAPSDFSTYCITAPSDPRLPGGGGYPVCGLADVSGAKFGQQDNLVAKASAFGEATRVSDFFSVNVASRFGGGIQLGGGVDTGRTVSDRCFVVDSPAQTTFDLVPVTADVGRTGATAANPSYCHIVTPFKGQTQIKVFGGYPIAYGFVVSGILQNVSGPTIVANYNATDAEIFPSLGRHLSSCGGGVVATAGCATATAMVPLVMPQTLFADRRTQLDLRLTKNFKVGRYTMEAHIDLYNVMNGSSIITLNTTYGPQWQQPTAVLDARLVQFGGRISF